MEELNVKGVKVEFDDLTEDAQRRLYLQNKELFVTDAANSLFFDIRMRVARDEKTPSSILNEMMRREVEEYGSMIIRTNLITTIRSNKNFKIEEETKNALSEELRSLILVWFDWW